MQKFLFILILFGSLHAVAQKKDQAAMDSLIKLLNTSHKDPTLQRASTLNMLGKIYLNAADHIHSMQCFSECLSIADKFSNDELIAECEKNMGIVYLYQHNVEKAEEFDQKALAIYRKGNDLSKIAQMLNGMGDDYLQQGDSARASAYFKEVLPMYTRLHDQRGAASVYMNQSTLCNGDYPRKIELALKADSIWKVEKTDNELPTVNTGNIGVAYLDMVRYEGPGKMPGSLNIPAGKKERLDLAEKYLLKAISMSRARNDVDNESYYTGVLAELQEQKGDFKNAYYNFRKYQNVTDSIFSQESKNKIAALESSRAIELKNREIENKELQIGNQHKRMLLLLGALAFLVVVGGLLYRQSRNRKKINTTLLHLNNELDEANRIKARFFGILSHDLRSPIANLINYLQLQTRKPGLMSEAQMADREKKIAASANAVLETMEAMLLWSKGQMEHFKPALSVVSVEQLFEYLKKLFADATHLRFTFICPDGLQVISDEHYLKAILYNLTANAVKAVRQTTDAHIEWKAWQERDRIFLSITDNGPGIADEQLKALYDDKVSSGAKQGLGLHIIRDLAKAIGCSIILNAQHKAGAEFILCLQAGVVF